MRVRMVVVVVVLVLELGQGLPVVAATAAGSATAAGGVRYLPPVPGSVVDPWRPPSTPYGAGNRGIDLDAEPGEAVRASADGEVVFAGSIAGSVDVVVLHADGLRTTYAFLATATVLRGQHVRQGDVVGTAAGPVHFGVRAGDEYLDPTALLFGPPAVHLVADRDRRPQSEEGERRGVLSFLSGFAHVSAAAATWAAGALGQGVEVGDDLVEWTARAGWTEAEHRLESLVGTAQLALQYLKQPVELLVALRQVAAYLASQAGCTPADRPPPPRSGRRIAVLVGGLDLEGGPAAITRLDTRALGYADADVAEFSYAGGEVAGARSVAHVPTTGGYTPRDADRDLEASADRLRKLVADVRAADPGVPIDVIAHGTGGLVARAALAGGSDVDPSVANLITIGSPHSGADLATGVAWVSSSGTGGLVAAGVGALTGEDLFSPAAHQLVEGSPFLKKIADEGVAAGRVTSIAGAGDLVVTANHSELDGAVNVLVPGAPGPNVHAGLAGSAGVQREVALALAGVGPTCRSLWVSMAEVVAETTAEDAIGARAGAAGFGADREIGAATVPAADAVGATG